jgi:hypothetical protein
MTTYLGVKEVQVCAVTAYLLRIVWTGPAFCAKRRVDRNVLVATFRKEEELILRSERGWTV